MTARETYRKLCWPDAPLFHQPFWLDAVAGHHWDVAMLEEQDSMKAYYLYAIRKSWSGMHAYMPELTQFLGPGYRIQEANERERLNRETWLLEQLCAALPPVASFNSRWQTGYFNWLPFYWMQYSQRVRYTYVLEELHDTEKLMYAFSDKIVREIRKAEKTLEVMETDDTEKFHRLILENFRNKRARVSMDLKVLSKVYQACRDQGCGKIWYAAGEQQQWAGAIFVAWDKQTAYYIIGAKDDSFGNSGAMSLLFWHAIKQLSNKVRSFDFEGSMIQGVENYFRSFGGMQRMFFEISHDRALLMKMRSMWRTLRSR